VGKNKIAPSARILKWEKKIAPSARILKWEKKILKWEKGEKRGKKKTLAANQLGQNLVSSLL